MSIYNSESGTTLVDSLTLPDSDKVACQSYEIKEGIVINAYDCTEKNDAWNKYYDYTLGKGAYLSSSILVETDLTGTESSISISYTNRLTNYICKYGDTEGSYTNTATDVTKSTCNISGINAKTTHYYQVCADNQMNERVCITGSYKYTMPGDIAITATGTVDYIGTFLSANPQVKFFDVTNGTACTEADWEARGGATSNSSFKNGCMRFYAYLEDDLSYTMILDHQTTTSGYGPSTSLTGGMYLALNNDTKDWQGTLVPQNYRYAERSRDYSINYHDAGFKARLITTREIATLMGIDFSYGLVNATYPDNVAFLKMKGLTSDFYSGSWIYTLCADSFSYQVDTSLASKYYGVTPVITVLKSTLGE